MELEPGQDLAALAEESIANGADALGMAGGDGSLAVLAAVACLHGLPFVCVPAGTLNHFALDVGVARHDLIGSLAAFADGIERRVDVGEVNGRVFLNNVSLGIYGDAVQRPGYRGARVRTLLKTTEEVLGPSATAPALDLVDDLGRTHPHAAVLLVSNNPYALDRAVAPGTRLRLDTGVLGIMVLDGPNERRQGASRAWSGSSLEVRAAGPVPAGVDGEAATLDPPLHFVSRPAMLRVRISSHHPGMSPGALLSGGSGSSTRIQDRR